MSVDELVKIGDLVRLDQDDSRILGLCIGLSKDKKQWRRRAKILWIGYSRVSDVLQIRLRTAIGGYNNIKA